MQFAIIGNPENRRTQYFIDAVRSQGLKSPFVISWKEVLQSFSSVGPTLAKTNFLKIDSPGENFQVDKRFLRLGAKNTKYARSSRISQEKINEMVFDKGRVGFLYQRHLGFQACLQRLEQETKKYPKLRLFNSIKSILLMFDKIACHQYFQNKNLPVPPALYGINSYDDLQTNMRQKSWKRVFIKPCYNSSASGVIAYRIHKYKEQAITSAELVRQGNSLRVYNSLKVRTYESKQDIKDLIDFFAKEGVLIEKWQTKATTEKGAFDIRVVVTGGEAKHIVVRQGQSPMTNLHLGNQRADTARIKDFLGKKIWADLLQLAEHAVSTLPGVLYVGMDIMINSRLKQCYILEANAFGDLLPNVLSNGMDTYSTQIHHLLSKQ
ncbi:MAG: STM4014 family protein [Spirochaetota bacterium]